jgi:hypothetical protein
MIAFQKGDSHGGHSARSRFIATAREPGQEDIFWIGANGDVSTTWRNDGIGGGNWHQQVGIAFPSSVRPDAPLIATAREPGQMDVFWIGARAPDRVCPILREQPRLAEYLAAAYGRGPILDGDPLVRDRRRGFGRRAREKQLDDAHQSAEESGYSHQ